MFTPKPVFGEPAGTIVPDDFVEEAISSEDGVEKDLAVVDFAIVDMEVEAAVAGKHPVGLHQPRL